MLRKLAIPLIAAALLSACASYTASVQGPAGKTYVIRHRFLGQDMLLCDATHGKPVCTVQHETE